MDQAEPAAESPLPAGQAGRLAAFLRTGGRIAALTGPGRSATREVLETALRAVPGLVIRTGNPLKTPLSLSRLMLQAGADPHAADEAAALLEAMSVHAGGRARAVLAIDDAHTLEPDALAVLKQLPMPGAEGALGIQLVFAGRAGVMERLAAAGFERLDDVAASLVLVVEGGDPGEAAPTPRPRAAGVAPPIPPPPPPLVKPVRMPAPGEAKPAPRGVLPGVLGGSGTAAFEVPGRLLEPIGAARTAAPAPGRRRRALLIAALAGSAVGVAAGVAGLWMLGKLPWLTPGLAAESLAEPAAAPAAESAVAGVMPVPGPGEAASAPAPPGQTPAPPGETPAPPPAAVEPMAPAAPRDSAAALAPAAAPVLAPVLAPALPPALPQGDGEARLRRDFDAFLRRSGWNGAARTPEAREALFQDYKDWLARNRVGPVPGPR